jgi:hypothetical protein
MCSDENVQMTAPVPKTILGSIVTYRLPISSPNVPLSRRLDALSNDTWLFDMSVLIRNYEEKRP